jgi:hypothetical protein
LPSTSAMGRFLGQAAARLPTCGDARCLAGNRRSRCAVGRGGGKHRPARARCPYAVCMCRYGMTNYKTHYVCVPCRRTLKSDPLDLVAGSTPGCPECAGPTLHVGRDFAAPRRLDDGAWRALAAVLDAGLRFDSCGCGGPGGRPRTPAAARARTRYAQRTGKPAAKALSEPYGVY